MGIEPTSLAWEARVIAIIRRPQSQRFYRVFWGLGSGVSWSLASKMAWLGGGAVASPGGGRPGSASFGHSTSAHRSPTIVGTAVDWTAVSREAHELALRHGPTAHVFALKLADQAQAAGDFNAARFWRAVSQSIATRTG